MFAQIPGGDVAGVVEEAGDGSKVSDSTRDTYLHDLYSGQEWFPSLHMHDGQIWHVSWCSCPCDVCLQFKKGDRVFGLTPWFWMTFKEGTYAEYVSAKEEWLAHCPKSLPLHEAGQAPLVALTAWQVPETWTRHAKQGALTCSGLHSILEPHFGM